MLWAFHVGKWKGRILSERGHCDKYNLMQIGISFFDYTGPDKNVNVCYMCPVILLSNSVWTQVVCLLPTQHSDLFNETPWYHSFAPNLAPRAGLLSNSKCPECERVLACAFMCGCDYYRDLSAVASCAAETCKGHYTAGILCTEQTQELNLDKLMMDPRLSAVSTSILLIPTSAPR